MHRCDSVYTIASGIIICIDVILHMLHTVTLGTEPHCCWFLQVQTTAEQPQRRKPMV